MTKIMQLLEYKGAIKFWVYDINNHLLLLFFFANLLRIKAYHIKRDEKTTFLAFKKLVRDRD